MNVYVTHVFPNASWLILEIAVAAVGVFLVIEVLSAAIDYVEKRLTRDHSSVSHARDPRKR